MAALDSATPLGPSVGWVIRAQSGFYTLETDEGPLVAVLRGKVKKDRRESGLVALGDLVRYERLSQPEGDSGQVEAVVAEILPRRSSLTRRAPGPKGAWAQDVVVANIDQLVPVFAARNPEPHMRMLDRFLAVAEIDEIDCLVVLNKVDLGVPPEVEAAMAEYERIGYPVIRTSKVTGQGLDALREALAGRVSAVVGPSGVGKSSLLNLVEPGLRLREGEVSDAVHKGRHTTRVGELHPLAAGGRVADTPGLREIGVWEVDAGELEWAYVEFRPYLNTCKYSDCTHDHEPGCAVLAAVAAGEISPERHASYVSLLADDPGAGW